MAKRKVILALVFAALIIGLTTIIRFSNEQDVKNKSATESLVQNIVEKSLYKDSDGDGLLSWEEALHKTDPGNPDSDGDGTSDGDEIVLGRNPNVQGPDDKEILLDEEEPIEKTDPTATDLFSKELFTKYLEAKKEGKTIDPGVASEIANELLSKSYVGDMEAFDPKKLNTTSDASFATLKAYGNELGTILKTPLPPGTESEILILEKISQGQTLTDKDKKSLGFAEERYATIKSKLERILVPIALVEMHAKIIDGIGLIKDGVKGISTLGTDPVGSYTRIIGYGDGLDLLEIVYGDLKSFFVNKNIIFSSVEGGYSLTE